MSWNNYGDKEHTIPFSFSMVHTEREGDTDKSAEVPIPAPCFPSVPLVLCPASTVIPGLLRNHFFGIWIGMI
jgi:hypothetical protein